MSEVGLYWARLNTTRFEMSAGWIRYSGPKRPPLNPNAGGPPSIHPPLSGLGHLQPWESRYKGVIGYIAHTASAFKLRSYASHGGPGANHVPSVLYTVDYSCARTIHPRVPCSASSREGRWQRCR